MKFFITLFFLCSILISASDDIKIVEILSSLDSSDGKNKEIYETSLHRGKLAQGLIEKRKKTFASSILNKHEDLTLKKIKYSDNFAIAIVVGNRVSHPYRVKVVPICFTRTNQEWRIAPMVTTFQFSKLIGSGSDQQQADALLDWSYAQSVGLEVSEQDSKKFAFFDTVSQKRLELNASCNSPKQVVEYFFKQIEKKSLSGILAVANISLDKNSNLNYSRERFINSLKIGLDSNIKKRGGWNLLANASIEKIPLKYQQENPLKNKNQDDLEKVVDVPYLFVDNALHVINFEVAHNPRGYYLILKDQLIASNNSNDDNDEVAFRQAGFSIWDKSPIESKIEDDLTRTVFESIAPPHSPLDSVHKLNAAINQSKASEKHFAQFLSYHTLENSPAKKEEQIVDKKIVLSLHAEYMKSSQQQGNYFYYQVSTDTGDKPDSSLSLKVEFNSNNIFETQLLKQFYTKNNQGWSIIANPKEEDLLTPLYQDKLEGKKVTEKEVKNLILKELVTNITILEKREASQLAKVESKEVRSTMQNYLASTKEKSLNKLMKLSGYSASNTNGWQQAFAEEFKKIKPNTVTELKKIFTSDKGMAAVLVQLTNKNKSEYLLYGILEQKGKYLVDFKNTMKISNNVKANFFQMLALNNRWKYIETTLGSEYKTFLYQAHKEAITIIK